MAEQQISTNAASVQFKTCKQCGESKPADRGHFGLDWSDPHRRRLRPRCLKCLAQIAAEYRKANPHIIIAARQRERIKVKWSPEKEHLYPLRRCTKCENVLPNNPEHFNRSARKDGLASWCKHCKAAEHEAKRDERNATTRKNYAKHRDNNPELLKQWRDSWRAANRDRYNELMRAGKARRRARLAEVGGTYSADDIQQLFVGQKGTCWWCGMKLKGFHVDHRIPLAKGGSNSRENLVISCPPCNQKRNARMPWEGPHPRLL